MNIKELLDKKGYLIADGATGTELIKLGVLKKNKSPEQLLLEDPEAFIKIHRSYYDAGSDYVVANNFGAGRLKLEEWGLENEFENINRTAVRCVKQALRLSGKKAFVASSLGPTGRLLPPLGASTMKELIAIYSEQVSIILNEGVDLFVIETISDLREAKACYIAIRDLCDLPVGVCLTFDDNGRTLLNNSPEAFATAFDSTDVMFIGANCSVGPDGISDVIKRMAEYTDKPIIVKPNAGVLDKNYSDNDFRNELGTWIDSGAMVFGGCCGTNPVYIKMFVEELKDRKLKKKIQKKTGTHLSSLSRTVIANSGLAPLVIGERINPTNKKQMIEELQNGKLDIVVQMAKEQISFGADLLDVNLGASGVDQIVMMEKTFHTLSSLLDIPLVVDSSDERVIEVALRNYGGKALINSSTAEDNKMDAVLKLAKKYGSAVICLTMDEKGIPTQAEERLKFVDKFHKKAQDLGMKKEDLVIDTLVLSLSSNQKEAIQTIKALELVRQGYGLSTSLGVSNVSYGLPERINLNQAFLVLAINAGVNFVIINPSSQKMMAMLDAMKVINDQDHFSLEYVKKYSGFKENKSENKTIEANNKEPLSALKDAIIQGDEVMVLKFCEMLKNTEHDLQKITSEAMLPAMSIVGEYFKTGKVFLPQVVLSAKAMKTAFEYLKKHKSEDCVTVGGVVVMATVKGDIHDIGKNIVTTLLETNGFRVVDLGKSVPVTVILEAVKKEKPDILGLSALMTTTMEEMEIVIKELRASGFNVPVMVGGAVVTRDFAESIGANYYAKDAMQAVDIVKKLSSS